MSKRLKSSPAQFVLLDCEMALSADIHRLHEHGFRVVLFIGADRKNINAELVFEMQAMGKSGEYVKMPNRNDDTLMMHMANFIGDTAANAPRAGFLIISEDPNYDAMVKLLAEKTIYACRCEDVDGAILSLHGRSAERKDKLLAHATKLLSGLAVRPKTIFQLQNYLEDALFTGNNLEDRDVPNIIVGLFRCGVIRMHIADVTYIWSEAIHNAEATAPLNIHVFPDRADRADVAPPRLQVVDPAKPVVVIRKKRTIDPALALLPVAMK